MPTIPLIPEGQTIEPSVSHSQDTAGPMARTVSDAAVLLGLLAEKELGDSKMQVDYSRFLDANGLKGARIGIAADFFGFHAEVEKLMKEAIHILKEKGAEVVENLKFEKLREWGDAENTVLNTEFKADLNAYLKTRTGLKVQSLADLIEFNKKNVDTEMKWFGQEIFEVAEKTKGLEDSVYLEALKKSKKLTREEGIDYLMDKHQLDALVAPTNGPAWTIDWVNGDHFSGGSSEAAAISGYPNITVPAGYVNGLPVGISFFGRAWSEPTLIRLAYAYEQATKHRKAPGFLKTIA